LKNSTRIDFRRRRPNQWIELFAVSCAARVRIPAPKKRPLVKEVDLFPALTAVLAALFFFSLRGWRASSFGVYGWRAAKPTLMPKIFRQQNTFSFPQTSPQRCFQSPICWLCEQRFSALLPPRVGPITPPLQIQLLSGPVDRCPNLSSPNRGVGSPSNSALCGSIRYSRAERTGTWFGFRALSSAQQKPEAQQGFCLDLRNPNLGLASRTAPKENVRRRAFSPCSCFEPFSAPPPEKPHPRPGPCRPPVGGFFPDLTHYYANQTAGKIQSAPNPLGYSGRFRVPRFAFFLVLPRTASSIIPRKINYFFPFRKFFFRFSPIALSISYLCLAELRCRHFFQIDLGNPGS